MSPGEMSEQINIRCSPEELKAFKRAAREAGLSLSAWMRIVMRRAAKLPTV